MTKLDIILIDDDIDEAELFYEAIQTLPTTINFRSFSDGTTALNFISVGDNLPDYIFLDLNMPIIPGKEVLKMISNESRFQGISIVIYSTSISKKDMEEATLLGASYFLTKPENFQQLCESIIKILNENRN